LVSVVMAKRKATSADTATGGDRLSIRLDLAIGARIGPGKVAVLEEIARSGSISAAGRALGMSYRRTWELVEELNRSLGTPVVATAAGGSGGGGAVLTQSGKAVIERYRAIEVDTALAARKHLRALHRACVNKLSAAFRVAASSGARSGPILSCRRRRL
jgi:molybdate transport system regulatory protein